MLLAGLFSALLAFLKAQVHLLRDGATHSGMPPDIKYQITIYDNLSQTWPQVTLTQIFH